MKGKPTVRHELKRIDSKRARAAEDAALRGDNHKLVRSARWYSVVDREPPLLDDVPQKGKKREKKSIEYCLTRKMLGEGNKRHYYIDKEEEIKGTYWNGEPYVYIRKWKVCMYCKQSKGRWWRW